MRQWAFNALTAISCLIFTVTAVLAVRAQVVGDLWCISIGQRIFVAEPVRQKVFLWSAPALTRTPRYWHGTGSPQRKPDVFDTYAPWSSGAIHCIRIGYWQALVACTIIPTCWCIVRSRNHVARMRGHCTTCGYDLRATPRRCPECGTLVPSPRTRGEG
jgi:hypothetical protein